jgi:transcriptional regulator with XRE-family HTH domain
MEEHTIPLNENELSALRANAVKVKRAVDKILKAEKVSIPELAERLGINYKTLSKIMSDSFYPSEEIVYRVENYKRV